jgi:DNA-binding NarL/FixJ family response regulator
VSQEKTHRNTETMTEIAGAGRWIAAASLKLMIHRRLRVVYQEHVRIGVSIIEDDGPAREIFADWIRRAKGFECVSDYGTAESAIESLPSKKPDVVLSDINLPGMSGIECVRVLKQRMPKTQFVMLTVYEDSNHLFDALMAGASGYLLKQTSREELLGALQDVNAGGSPMSSNIARKVVQSFRREEPLMDESVKLTPREFEVLQLLACGDLYKEIADQLKISIPTVNTHVRSIYEKLHVRSRAQAVAKYANITPSSARLAGHPY